MIATAIPDEAHAVLRAMSDVAGSGKRRWGNMPFSFAGWFDRPCDQGLSDQGLT